MKDLFVIVRASDNKIVWSDVCDADYASERAATAALGLGVVQLLSGADLGQWLLNRAAQ